MILIESLLTKAGSSEALNEAEGLDGDFEISKVLLTEKRNALRGEVSSDMHGVLLFFSDVCIHSSRVCSSRR